MIDNKYFMFLFSIFVLTFIYFTGNLQEHLMLTSGTMKPTDVQTIIPQMPKRMQAEIRELEAKIKQASQKASEEVKDFEGKVRQAWQKANPE